MSVWFIEIRGGAPTSLRAAAALTNAYVASSSVDLKSYDSVAIAFGFSATDSGKTCTVKYQWSNDDAETPTNWYNETIEESGTAASGELPCAGYVKTTTMDMTNDYGSGLIMRMRRLGRHFRVAVKGNTSTTATLVITAMPMRNMN